MTTKSKAPIAERDNTVSMTIREGVAMSRSALETLRNAALLFVKTVNPTGLESNNIMGVVQYAKELYADDFADDSNAKSYFGDVVLLSLAGSMPISFVDRKKAEIQTTGEKATQLAKHDLKTAAKTVREELGEARASGGGRKPKTPTKASIQHVFSAVEFKSQLAGLFGNSQNPVKVLNDMLAEYHCEVTPIEKRKTRAKRAA